MTHADIVAWWAFAIAVLAIVLHVPLSMLAHHYLPKAEDYFASKSREKLVKRIATLEHRLAQLNDPRYFEDTEWELRAYSFAVMYLLAGGLFTQAGSLLPAPLLERALWRPIIHLIFFPKWPLVSS